MNKITCDKNGQLHDQDGNKVSLRQLALDAWASEKVRRASEMPAGDATREAE